MAGRHIPEDLLIAGVLPYLSAKSLSRCKIVSQRWLSAISSDPVLADRQSRRPSAASCGAVFADHHTRSLAFIPTFGSPVGVPDPTLGFSRASVLELQASANGLLLLHVVHAAFQGSFLYVCNPATNQGHRVPDSAGRGGLPGNWASVGLAFDPAVAPSRYSLVHLRRANTPAPNAGAEYRFDVFSSDTGRWARSGARLLIKDFIFIHTKVVFAQKTLFWECMDRVLFYRLADDSAGTVMLPTRQSGGEQRIQQEIGVWDGTLSFTRVDKEAVEAWKLAGDGWRREHRIDLEDMLVGNARALSGLWHCMSLRSRRVSAGFIDRLFVRPLPYEGGKRIFLRVRRWEVAKEILMSYNLETGKMEEFGLRISRRTESARENFFSYHNSLAPVPVIQS